MIQIKNGLLYDTDKAQLLAETEKGMRPDEKLYKTKKGRYFLWGHKMKVSYQGAYSSGCCRYVEIVTPLTPDEAHKWAEDKLSVEEYIRIFGKPEEA